MSELRGNLDLARLDRIAGWALDAASPAEPAMLRVLDNGLVIARISPDVFRGDLTMFGGDGKHGFSYAFPAGLSPDIRHVINVQWEEDFSDLPGSPWIIEAQRDFTTGDIPAYSEDRPPLRGLLDLADRDHVEGWAWDIEQPDESVTLRVVVNDAVITRAVANRYREDLESAGIGDGRHAFQINIPGGLSPLSRQVIRVLDDKDGREIEGSPHVIEATTRFDKALESAFENAVLSLDGAEQQAQILKFLTTLADKLLQRHADTKSQSKEREAYRRFRRRWGPAAKSGADDSSSIKDPGLRALIIDDEVPAPDRDAGSRALISHMRALKQLSYTVSFIAAHDLNDPSVTIDALAAEGIECCHAPFYLSVEEVLERQAQCFDLIYFHRISNASKYMALARQHQPRARIVYSVADLSHLRLARQAKIEDRPELLAESRRARLLECTAAWSADAVLTHSLEEVAWLRQSVPEAQVYLTPWAVAKQPVTVPFAKRKGVAFIGSYSHQPNTDAAIFLVEEVMPLVWRHDPDIECLLVGSRMPQAVRNLARPGITVMGQIADLHDIFNRVRLTVAPLRYGAGVKGKVLDSLAAGIPCVMTPIAAEGMCLPPLFDDVIGADADALATRILRLHREETFHDAITTAGLDIVEGQFSEARVREVLKAAIDGVQG